MILGVIVVIGDVVAIESAIGDALERSLGIGAPAIGHVIAVGALAAVDQRLGNVLGVVLVVLVVVGE